MKLFVHPSTADVTLQGIFYALGDEMRLQIVRNLHRAGDKPLSCMDAVAGIKDMATSTRSHNFRVLREAGLVWSEKNGREAKNILRFKEVEKKFPGLLKIVLKHL